MQANLEAATMSDLTCPGDLVFRHLDLDVKGKRLLHDVSGFADPGTMLALMGPSGAGKSTLLHALSGRPPAPTAGELLIGGQGMSKRLRRQISYVMQEDILLENLTVRETLEYTAMLRLPDDMPAKEKRARANELAEAFELVECLDTKVGGAFNKGISGGQKKRTSVACELLTKPVLLLLDEPTSGLDSSTAHIVMKTLKDYARTTRTTVVASIHQPSSQMFFMFTRLLLLHAGRVAYFGENEKVLDFFASLGLRNQPNYNAADFILERVSDGALGEKIVHEFKLKCGLREVNGTDREARFLCQQLVEAGNTHGTTAENATEEDIGIACSTNSLFRKRAVAAATRNAKESDDKWPTGFLTQYTTLVRRNFKQFLPGVFSKWNIAQTLVIALFIGLIWFQMPRTESTIPDRLGLCFFINTYWSFVIAGDAVVSFMLERSLLMKERTSGYYRLSAYYLARITSELPLTLVMPSLYIVIVYWMTGLNGYVAFFKTWAVVIASALTAQSVGNFFGATLTNLRTAMTIENVSILLSLLAGGFYSRSMPFWLSWVKYMSFLFYAYFSVLSFEFGTENFSCLPENETAYCTTVYSSIHALASQRSSGIGTNGSSSNITAALAAVEHPATFSGALVLEALDVVWPEWAYPLSLVGMTLLLRIITYLVLRVGHALK